MRNYDYWKEVKKDQENKIILILSWIFYKTFNYDARFLSDNFWFKIKEVWWYESIWFPKSVLEKYLNKLKQKNIWYFVLEKSWEKNNFSIEKEFEWWQKIEYKKEKLIYLKCKLNNNKSFQDFLEDLKNLIWKYKIN